MGNLWCEIDLNKMRDNVDRVRQKTDKKILAVVKCNAYGLGIEQITSSLDELVDGFVVQDLDEAVKVRSNKPVLILLPNIAEEELNRIKDNFILTIDNIQMLEILKNGSYTVHIFVDSGMHRFGIKLKDVDGMIGKMKREYPNVTIDGIYTHLNHPRNGKYTRKQIAAFSECVEKYRYEIPRIHLLNSAGYMKYNDIDFDNYLRIGNLLYGYCGEKYGFKKTVSYKARLVSTTKAGRNQYVGYGNRYKTKRETCIGVLGVGFIHGFNCVRNVKSSMLHNIMRQLYHSIRRDSLVFLRGKPVKIMGGSSMNFTQVDLNGLKVNEHSLFDIKLSSILADGTITKKYLD